MCVDIPYNQHHHGLLHHADARKRSALSCDLHKVWVAAACLRACTRPVVATAVGSGGRGYGCSLLQQCVNRLGFHPPLDYLTIYACRGDLFSTWRGCQRGSGHMVCGGVGRRRWGWGFAAVTADCVLGCACRQSAAGCRACCALPWTSCVPLWRLVSALQGSA